VGDAIALLDAEALQCGGKAIAAIEELAVSPSLPAVNDAFAAGVQLPRTPHEIQWTERNLHAGILRAVCSRESTVKS
jgi:hypothetical protein